ncbi:UbiD family decarboxylase [Aquabacter spiritensis]|uniref:2,5-furandicarboxylate decarboxylase 1 n=1 Tax=Aquabacter spiritensis TaxID=933073 RepID=A0A4R3LYB9_9HYPH|nr:UbiD family decarboxylase [Aquabacter spiritensis]TCT05691.1 2,5-furandicarboxylate decarboxylase 1 [Aquabacter spiritensis]
MVLSNSVDTGFRPALARLAADGRIRTFNREADPHLEIGALMKKLDGQEMLLFPKVRGFDTPVVGNLLSSRENCESAFGRDYKGIRETISQALTAPLAPVVVETAPVHEVVETANIDLGKTLPALFHAPKDGGRYVTSGILVAQDPETGVYNASYHRLQLIGPDRLAIKLDYGRHLRLAVERAQKQGKTLQVAVCIGADLALHFTAATMGSQMPENLDELAVAGGLSGRPLSVVKGRTVDLMVPAECEYVLEGEISADEVHLEGPFGEFVGFAAPAADAPVLKVTALTRRAKPIYHAINGYGRETIMLRKYVLEASLLKVLRAAVPIVTDAEMTAGGLHRFHAILQVDKQGPQHEGLQRNAILAAFGALKDLDMVIVVDDDIDIRDPADVEYALATRMEASGDLIVIPEARGHEYVRISRNGVRAKLGMDATVPAGEKERFRRVAFSPVQVTPDMFSAGAQTMADLL